MAQTRPGLRRADHASREGGLNLADWFVFPFAACLVYFVAFLLWIQHIRGDKTFPYSW